MADRPTVQDYGPLGKHLERREDDSAFDAAARDRTGHPAVLVHEHRRARVARRRAVGADHACDREATTVALPGLDLVEQVLDGHPSCTSSSSVRHQLRHPRA